MARTRAGKRYPHITTDARPHNHQMCPVVRVILSRAMLGAEPWGHRHDVGKVPSETVARAVKQAFYSARYCRELAEHAGEEISIQCDWERLGDTEYLVWVRAWPRSVARAEIARRVRNQEPLAYNVMRS